MTEPTTIDNFYQSEAYQQMYRDYREDVRRIVADARREVKDFGGDVNEQIEQTCDGHGWVIYTGKAALVAIVSDVDWHDEADELGMTAPTTEQIAYMCLLADCWEELARTADEDENGAL